jgi:DNA-binding NtrC family response regulator
MDGLVERPGSLGTISGYVLVVDDDAALRREVASALKMTGLNTVEAFDADAALAAITLNPDIAVVLTDIRMPGRSGIALAEQMIAAQPGQRAVEVVLMSGLAGFDEALGAVRAGAFDLLRKPFCLAEIGAAKRPPKHARTAATAASTATWSPPSRTSFTPGSSFNAGSRAGASAGDDKCR